MRWAERARRADNQELLLDADTIEKLQVVERQQKHRLLVPDAFSAVGTVLAANEEAINRGDYRILFSHATGPSGMNLLGRFCYASDELTERVRNHLNAEQALRPDVIFAEIVHVPQGRTGNVLLRPQLRPYEIPYLGRASVPKEFQIPVDDLYLSVIDDRVVMYSRRLATEIIPRLSAAHDFDSPGNLGLYRFLGALQRQGLASTLQFSFGALDRAPFTPRVTSGRLVLARAKWTLSSDELAAFVIEDRVLRFSAVQALRLQLRLPRWVALVDRDKSLPLDLENVLCIDALGEMLKNRSHATLIEVFLQPDDVAVRGPEGRFAHELVLPFVRVAKRGDEPALHPTRRFHGTTQRSFHLGSDWLYAKLYATCANLDVVLTDLVHPAIAKWLAAGSVDSWFFIRYSDPEWHVRLRLRGDPQRLLTEVAPELLQYCARLTGSILWRVEFETYEREVERYGGEAGILLAEQLFCADSDLALEVIGCPSVVQPHSRLGKAVAGIDRLLSNLGFDLAHKKKIMSEVLAAATEGLHMAAESERHVSELYRAERKALESLIADDRFSVCNVAFSGRVQALSDQLRHLESGRLLTKSVKTLAKSFMHMHANRVLQLPTREQEFVVHGLLSRLYASRIARAALGRD